MRRNLKVILLCVFNCILFVQCLNSKEIASPDDEQIVGSSAEAEVKINWLPTWDDNEGNNEFVFRISADDSGEGKEQICRSPNGLGLENLFREANKILPNKQINAIVKSYAEDQEIKALKAFMESSQTKDKIKAIHSSQEYQILKDYACRVLHIDLSKYSKLVKTLVQPQLTRADNTQARKGIRGLINEVNAIIPRQQLRELYQQLLASDDELAKAVDSLKSKEFHQLLLNLKNNVSEYQQLRQQLIDLGVPIEEMQQLLVTTLGWAPLLTLVP